MQKLSYLFWLAFFSIVNLYAQGQYTIVNIDANTDYSDFGVSFYKEDAVFASARPADNKSKKKWTNGQPYLDLYRATIDKTNGEFLEIKSFSDKIETKYHESNAVFTKDNKTVYFTRNNYYKHKLAKDSLGWNNIMLMRAEVDESGNWMNVRPLPFNDANYSVGHPALSPDEKTLYFTSDMPGSLGQTDIFRVTILNGDRYSKPENLGPAVNGPNREMFPFVSVSGKLYYSTNKGGFGGLDIYMIETSDLQQSPVQLPRPINSNLDDFCFIIDDQTHTGYFSSNRSGGKGDDDIYYFEEYIEPEVICKQSVTGVVKDSETGQLLPEATVLLKKDGITQKEFVVGQEAGFNFVDLDCETSYEVSAVKESYVGERASLSTTDIPNQVILLDLQLKPEVTREEYLDNCQDDLHDINTIYFDLDKYYIRPDAAKELDKIVLAMNKCSDVKVIAGSHTDSRGSDVYNIRLSQNRAQATVDYIVRHGISFNRIKAMGYGETQLLNHCSNGVKCSKEEHQQNRRTEFVIVRE